MEVYIYSGHVFGNLYVLTEEQDEDSLYCEECGDSDYLELHTNSIWEVKEWLRSQLDVFGLGGYSEVRPKHNPQNRARIPMNSTILDNKALPPWKFSSF